MITQFPIRYIDRLVLEGMDRNDILQSIFVHSYNEEERDDLIDYNFIMDSDLSTLDKIKLYSIDINNVSDH